MNDRIRRIEKLLDDQGRLLTLLAAWAESLESELADVYEILGLEETPQGTKRTRYDA